MDWKQCRCLLKKISIQMCLWSSNPRCSRVRYISNETILFKTIDQNYSVPQLRKISTLPNALVNLWLFSLLFHCTEIYTWQITDLYFARDKWFPKWKYSCLELYIYLLKYKIINSNLYYLLLIFHLQVSWFMLRVETLLGITALNAFWGITDTWDH